MIGIGLLPLAWPTERGLPPARARCRGSCASRHTGSRTTPARHAVDTRVPAGASGRSNSVSSPSKYACSCSRARRSSGVSLCSTAPAPIDGDDGPVLFRDGDVADRGMERNQRQGSGPYDCRSECQRRRDARLSREGASGLASGMTSDEIRLALENAVGMPEEALRDAVAHAAELAPAVIAVAQTHGRWPHAVATRGKAAALRSARSGGRARDQRLPGVPRAAAMPPLELEWLFSEDDRSAALPACCWACSTATMRRCALSLPIRRWMTIRARAAVARWRAWSGKAVHRATHWWSCWTGWTARNWPRPALVVVRLAHAIMLLGLDRLDRTGATRLGRRSRHPDVRA